MLVYNSEQGVISEGEVAEKGKYIGKVIVTFYKKGCVSSGVVG